MTANETAAIRQMLTDVISTHTAEINGKFLVIDEKLNSITIQTTRTNGTVKCNTEDILKLKESSLTHFTSCPVSQRVKGLEDKELSRNGIKQFVIRTAGWIIASATLIIAFLEYKIRTK